MKETQRSRSGLALGATLGLTLIMGNAVAGTMQLFGVVDASLEYANGSKSVVRMREGQQAASRWGIRGASPSEFTDEIRKDIEAQRKLIKRLNLSAA
ncbi:hypothetical protein [Cupriavidus basilensis]